MQVKGEFAHGCTRQVNLNRHTVAINRRQVNGGRAIGENMTEMAMHNDNINRRQLVRAASLGDSAVVKAAICMHSVCSVVDGEAKDGASIDIAAEGRTRCYK